jgi:hypothetical protein
VKKKNRVERSLEDQGCVGQMSITNREKEKKEKKEMGMPGNIERDFSVR